ncbi:hypothetical protein DFQ28_003248 [Apophysomyces sp. BC1034]|nr:hypothetical protein DFQ30_006307 [Apophysomyces sp. BC1015]KAG0179567.1 hypothetical protein DFQ29_001917 [Apophysomyces sp. BC1021]KAG0189576.1 hypothetical protein DFQ28_003248 [Apophysomyces sp. BC1034]
MSAPSVGLESIYRNSLQDVKRFLDGRHGEHYKIFNLRSEKSYKADMFDHAPVVNYPFDDHQSPPFDLMLKFCQDASAWIQLGNIIVVHCKAGKGRTGTMIASLLLYLGETHTADEAMHMYAAKRTKDGKEHPVCHFWLHAGFLSDQRSIRLKKEEIDKAFTDVECTEFDKGFAIDVDFVTL